MVEVVRLSADDLTDDETEEIKDAGPGPIVPRFDDDAKDAFALPLHVRSMQTLSNQLSTLNGRIGSRQQAIAEMNADLRNALDRAAQTRVEAIEMAEAVYAKAVSQARNGHLASMRQAERELESLVATRNALTLACEALERVGD